MYRTGRAGNTSTRTELFTITKSQVSEETRSLSAAKEELHKDSSLTLVGHETQISRSFTATARDAQYSVGEVATSVPPRTLHVTRFE